MLIEDVIPGKDQRIFIYHENRDLNMALRIKREIPNDYYVMWRGRHFVVGKPINWNITKFLQSCRKMFVVLNSNYKDTLDRFRLALESSRVHVSRITFILLPNVYISADEIDASYLEVFGTLIKLDPDAIITDAIQQELKAAIAKIEIHY